LRRKTPPTPTGPIRPTLYGRVPGMTTAIETEFGTIEGESSAGDAFPLAN
jgi:hypothetical protein